MIAVQPMRQQRLGVQRTDIERQHHTERVVPNATSAGAHRRAAEHEIEVRECVARQRRLLLQRPAVLRSSTQPIQRQLDRVMDLLTLGQ